MTGAGSRLGLVALAAVVLLAAAAPVSGSPAQSPAGVDPDSVLLRVSLAPDGDARWLVEYRIRLSTAEEVAAFDDLQAAVDADPEGYERRFAALLNRSVRRAASKTGREMALTDVTVSTERRGLPRETGVVAYTFTWTGFAPTTPDGGLAAGDVLGGFYVDEETTLMLTWPDGYRAASVAPEPSARRGGVAAWSGPIEFAGDEPRVRLEAAPTATPAGPAGGATDGGDRRALLPLVGLATVVVAAAGWGLVRGRRDDPDDGASADPTGVAAAAERTELLSNEERVLAFLEESGGRARQREIADALGWTAPKTSKVVGRLRDDGAVAVFRLGRENVVTLPGESLL